MNPGLKFLMIAAFTLSLTSCGDKVDDTLSKAEKIVAFYEDKAENKTLNHQDISEMDRKLYALDEEYRIKVGKRQSEWTKSQRDRQARMMARKVNVESSGFRLNNPF